MERAETLRVSPLVLTAAFITALLASVFLTFSHASAASLTQTFVRFDRMQTSQQTTGTVCAKQATAGTQATVKVTFPTGYTLGAAGTFTVNTTNLAWPTGGTIWPGIGTATNVTGQIVTFPSTASAIGTLYCFNWANSAAVQVSAAATSNNSGSVDIYTVTPTLIDTGTYSTASVTTDQIAVSATVAQTFSFALANTTDNLGALTTGAVKNSATPATATVNTNAKNGWYVWAKDANTGLTSTSASKTIASSTPGAGSPATLVAGTEGYNTGVTQTQTGGTGTVTVAAGFVGSANTGGGLDTSLRTLASSNGTANNAVLTLTNNVAINTTTAAASDYADTITVVGAGLF